MKKTSLLKYIIVTLLLVLPASFNLFTNRGFSFHDETQIANLFEYNKVISLGQFPPRWSPDTHFTYGSPYLEFNYQLPYYLGVFFHKVGFSLLNSYKMVLAFSFFVGGFGMLLLGRKVSNPKFGLLSAFLFTYTPYRAVDVYVRGTIGEAMAIGIYPWIFWSLIKLKQERNITSILLVSLSVSALILTHQPSTVFGLPLIFLIFTLTELVSKNFRFFLLTFVSLLIAIGLTSYYLIPVIFEQKYIYPVLPFNFYDHFPFIKQLIYSKWDYGVSIEGPYDGMSFQVGLANITIVISGLIAFIYLWQKKQLSKNLPLVGVLLSIIVGFYFMNIRSSFFWSIFPYTSSIQFPWRILAIMAFLTSYLYLILLSKTKGVIQRIFVFLIPLIVIINNFGYFHPGTIVEHKDTYYLRRYLPNQVLLKGEKVSLDYLDYTENYLPLPKGATRPDVFPADKVSSPLTNTLIEVIDNNPFDTKAKVTTKMGDFITINTFYYPGWNVTIDGKSVNVTLNEIGGMKVFVPGGEHHLNLKFLDTPVRKISNIISFVTLFIVLAILFSQKIITKSGKHR